MCIHYLPCHQCNGKYVIRERRSDGLLFAGCSNYPQCRSTISSTDFFIELIDKYGVNIYKWERKCFKCGKITPVYSYFINFDYAYGVATYMMGLGDINCIDSHLASMIDSIRYVYSHESQRSYYANTCIHCKAIQGYRYVVDDPHEIIHDRCNNNLSKYFAFNIRINDREKLYQDLYDLFN